MQSLLSGGCLYIYRAVSWARGRTHDSSVKEKEDKVETEDMAGRGDFRGVYSKDPDSRFRKMINRIKSKTVSDPVMKGKIINATGGRCARFCADTGCSVNIQNWKLWCNLVT